MSDSKLQRSALIAEIVGTIAIVLSLLLVAYELRQNTAANYAASIDALSNAQFQWRSNILSRPELMLAWKNQIESDADTELAAGILIGEQLLLIYERAYFLHKYERLGGSEWERYRKSMCGPLAPRIMPAVLRSNFTDEFWHYLQECSSQGS